MLTILRHILKNQQNENENEHLRFYILRFSLFKGLGNVRYFVHWATLSLSETDSPVGGWYHALSSKPPLHCGSRWSGRSWTPSSPPYLCSTIKSNWWLIISEHTSTEPCPKLPSVHWTVSSCKLQRPPMVQFYCDSPGSTAHQVNPLCWKLLRRTDASWVLTGGLSIIKTGYSGALILLVVERLLILERFQRENNIKRVIMDGEPN